jgi:hypothetical protein
MYSIEEEKRDIRAAIARHNEYLRNLEARIENANDTLKLNGTVAQWRYEFTNLCQIVEDLERKLAQLG